MRLACTIKEAKYAGATPDIELVGTASMMHTTAATMNRKRERKEEGKAFFWVPKIGAEVRVLIWAAASKQNSADQPGVTQEELHSSGNHGPAELTAADEGAELATRFLMETDCE